MSRLASVRAVLRIARRTAWRSKGRTALVLAMVGVPVFAGVAVTTIAATEHIPWQSELAWQMGKADAGVDVSGQSDQAARIVGAALVDPSGRADEAALPGLLAGLPAGSRYTLERQWYDATLSSEHGDRQVTSVSADLTDPILEGRYRLRDGELPAGPDQIAVSPALADDLDLSIGDRVSAGSPANEYQISGLVDWPKELNLPLVVSAPDAPIPGHIERGSRLLVDLPGRPGFGELDALFEDVPFSVLPWLNWKPTQIPIGLQDVGPILIVGAFAVAEIVLLAGTAFAVGVRRATRELGLLGATGGTIRQVGGVVLGGGLVLGTLAAVTGTALAIVGVVAAHPLIEHFANHVVDGTTIPVAKDVGILVAAILAAVLAAVLPARGAARRPALDALTGRHARAAGSRRPVLVGLGLITAGTALTAVGAIEPTRVELVAAGSVLGLAGFALCGPGVVSLVGRVAGRFPLSVRLGLRDAARNRYRTGAAVAAVTAAVAGSAALLFVTASDNDRRNRADTATRVGQAVIYVSPENTTDLSPRALAPVAAELPSRDVLAITSAVIAADGSGPSGEQDTFSVRSQVGSVAIGDEALIRAVTGRDPDQVTLAALRSGRAVVLNPDEAVRDGQLTLTGFDGTGQTERRVPAVRFPAPASYYVLPAVLISAETAQELGFGAQIDMYLFDTTRPPTDAERGAAAAALAVLDDPSDDSGLYLSITERPHSDDTLTMLALIGISFVLTVLATGIAVGLAQAESRADLSTLMAVGAAPRVRRALSAGQSLVIAGLGSVLGTLAGVLPAAGSIRLLGPDMRWVVPWEWLGVLIIAVPVLITLLTGLVTRSKLILVRRLA